MAKRFYVQGLELTPGKHTYAQPIFADKMKEALKGLPDPEKVYPLIHFTYSQSGIIQRHIEFDFEEVAPRRDWYRVVNEASTSIATRSVRQLLSNRLPVSECDGLVVVSGGHSGWPSLSRKLQMVLELPETAICYDLSGYGCAGVPHGIFLAQMLLRTERCQNVCVVSVDAMLTHGLLRKNDQIPPMSQFVAYCLVSDGAASLILSNTPGKNPLFSYEESTLQTKIWRGSLDWNVLSADENNQPFIFVGREVRYRAPEELAKVLDAKAMSSPIIMHPGGLALLRKVNEKYPSLSHGTKLAATVMRENGNLGASTVLWVLGKAFQEGYAISPTLNMIAIGAGKTTAVLHFEGTKYHSGEKPAQ
jgi:predicted naringenin-chalcone synthase